MKAYIPERPGEIVTTSGARVGRHRGAHFYTIGQRHIDAEFTFPKTGATGKAAVRKPFYVAAKDATTNTVTMAEGADDPALYRREVRLVQMNFIGGREYEGAVRARVRYRQPLGDASLAKGAAGDWILTFAAPQKFVAEGQSAVFYAAQGEMLGGGVIV